MLPSLCIEIKYNSSGEQRMFLNGDDVSEKIRTPEVSILASDVSSLQGVRNYLLDMQRNMAEKSSVIMDGRDIGTVVLPDADVKIFLTASSEARAERRLKELVAKGIDTDFDSVLRDIEYRDNQDSTRAAAPLKAAPDAVVADTSLIDFDESFSLLCNIIDSKLSS